MNQIVQKGNDKDVLEQVGNNQLKQKKKKHNSKRRKSKTFCAASISSSSSEFENISQFFSNVIKEKKLENSVRPLLPVVSKEPGKKTKNLDRSVTMTFGSQSGLGISLSNLKSKYTKNRTIKSNKKKNMPDSSSRSSNSSYENKEKNISSKEKSKKKLLKNLESLKSNLNQNGFTKSLLKSEKNLELIGSSGLIGNQENICDNYCEIKMTNQLKYVIDKKIPNLVSSKYEKLKKKRKDKKCTPNDCGNEKNTSLDSDQKVLINSKFSEKSELTKARISTSLNSASKINNESQKSKSLEKNNFPKYLSPSELQLMNNYGVLISGIIRINKRNYKEAYITAPDKGTDILIEGLRDRNRALEGDEVYVLLKPKEHLKANSDTREVQRTAVVVGLKTLKHNRRAIGTLNPFKDNNSNNNTNFVLFSPRDPRLPRVKILKNNWPEGFAEDSESFKDKLFFVKICRWNDVRFAEGKLVKELGSVGDIEAETNAILLKYNFEAAPYDDALAQYNFPSTLNITEEDIASREDFRHNCVFTIDPATAADLDDAVSCKLLPNGNYEIGVHISDVSYHLKEGMPLDLLVSERATTVYLVQRAYHMLPDNLCRLCSLTPGEDKFSFSVIWEFTPTLEIVGHRIARTVINSCGQFSYEQAQAILDNLPLKAENFPKIYGNHTMEDIRNAVLFLNKVAIKLRGSRFTNGALRIDQKKIKFSLDDMELPLSFSVEVRQESHQLIEEFMLLANMTVAEELVRNFPKIAFLRSHSPPAACNLTKLKKNLEKSGIHIDISSAGSINTFLLKYSDDHQVDSAGKSLVLNNFLAKLMTRAKYYCSGVFPKKEDRHHYALNVALYTHFTSPIRRYADIMVHRLLTSLITHSDPPKWTTKYVESIAKNCNEQKYAAKLAAEDSLELYLTTYINFKGYVEFDAVVSDVKDRSFDCIILTTGTHQRVFLESIEAKVEQTTIDGVLSLTVIWPIDSTHPQQSKQFIKLFSIVKLELKKGRALKLEARLLRED